MNLALASVDAQPRGRSDVLGGALQPPAVIRSGGGVTETNLMGPAAAAFIEATRLEVASEDEPIVGRYHLIVVTTGAGWIEGDFGRLPIVRGDTLAMPATLEHRYRAGCHAHHRFDAIGALGQHDY